MNEELKELIGDALDTAVEYGMAQQRYIDAEADLKSLGEMMDEHVENLDELLFPKAKEVN